MFYLVSAGTPKLSPLYTLIADLQLGDNNVAARTVRATNKTIEAAIDWYNVLKNIPDLWNVPRESQLLATTV
jgi:hypothetical protein